MTKKVRVENADTANFKVVVEVWDRGMNGEPDTKVFERELSFPTAMTGDDIFITSTRYLVVREAE